MNFKQATLLSALAALSAPLSLGAQNATSPAGLDAIEGNSSTAILFGAIERRFQQIDGTHIGMGPQSITQIGLRRDGSRATPSATARTFDLTIRMGHGDSTSVSAQFDNNYLAPASTVFATQTVSLPDWSASVPGPAPFDFVVTLDSAFNYNGTDALVIELVIENSSSTGTVWVDRQLSTTPFEYAGETFRTAGCTSGGGIQPFESHIACFNWGNQHPSLGQRVIVHGDFAPPDALSVAHIALDLPAIPVPGLCGPFLNNLIVALSLGTSSSTGFTPYRVIDIPYNPVLDTTPIAVQVISIDATQPGIPVSLSDVRASFIPSAPSTPLDCHYVYAGPTDATGTPFSNRGILFELQ